MNTEKYKNEIKYRFTKYLETAVKRTRNHYIAKETKKAAWEDMISDSDSLLDNQNMNSEETDFFQPYLKLKSLCAETIRLEWSRYAEGALRTSVLDLNDKEIMVLFARVYWELDFTEIGVLLSMDAKKASNIYSYIRKKLKKGGVSINGI